jgi:hypothetical protein
VFNKKQKELCERFGAPRELNKDETESWDILLKGDNTIVRRGSKTIGINVSGDGVVNAVMPYAKLPQGYFDKGAPHGHANHSSWFFRVRIDGLKHRGETYVPGEGSNEQRTIRSRFSFASHSHHNACERQG